MTVRSFLVGRANDTNEDVWLAGKDSHQFNTLFKRRNVRRCLHQLFPVKVLTFQLFPVKVLTFRTTPKFPIKDWIDLVRGVVL